MESTYWLCDNTAGFTEASHEGRVERGTERHTKRQYWLKLQLICAVLLAINPRPPCAGTRMKRIRKAVQQDKTTDVIEPYLLRVI